MLNMCTLNKNDLSKADYCDPSGLRSINATLADAGEIDSSVALYVVKLWFDKKQTQATQLYG